MEGKERFELNMQVSLFKRFYINLFSCCFKKEKKKLDIKYFMNKWPVLADGTVDPTLI